MKDRKGRRKRKEEEEEEKRKTKEVRRKRGNRANHPESRSSVKKSRYFDKTANKQKKISRDIFFRTARLAEVGRELGRVDVDHLLHALRVLQRRLHHRLQSRDGEQIPKNMAEHGYMMQKEQMKKMSGGGELGARVLELEGNLLGRVRGVHRRHDT